MAIRIFDNDIVRVHPIFKDAPSSLADVSKRDYSQSPFDPRIECLDMDCYESNFVKHGSNDSTMDVTIGVADYDGNRKSNSTLLMVELRLGYQSVRNLKSESLNKKVLHTLELLNPAECSVSKDAVFVFSERVLQQARSWLSRYGYSNHTKKDWVVMSPQIFKKAYMCVDDVPYTPLFDYEEGKKIFEKAVSERNWEEIIDNFDMWGKRYCRCYSITHERELITELLKGVWQEVTSVKNQFDDSMWEVLAQLEDEWSGILKG